MVEGIRKDAFDEENRRIGIAHCNNYPRALFVKEMIQEVLRFKEILIVDTAGISSLYASDGGIIVCY